MQTAPELESAPGRFCRRSLQTLAGFVALLRSLPGRVRIAAPHKS